MVELTGGGDSGTTGLLGGGRVPKDDRRIEAFGTIDEASSAIGLAKALTRYARVRAICEELQRGLYALGAELSTNPKSKARFSTATADAVGRLEAIATELENAVTMPSGFVLPGTTPASAALDVARAVARRAERRSISLAHAGGLDNPEALRWLNRLSLVLFVLARYEEARSGRAAKGAKARARATD